MKGMRSALLCLVFLVSMAVSAEFDPVLRMVLGKEEKIVPQAFISGRPNEVKVLYRDGTVGVFPFDRETLKTFTGDESVLYIEAPRRLKPLMDVVRSSSIVIVSDGNTSFSIRTGEGQRLKLRTFGTGSVSFSGSCSGSPADMMCSAGNVNFDVGAQGSFRLIVLSENMGIKTSDVSGATSFYTGASASLFGKTGRGIVLAIIDTGINPCHPAFLNPDGTSRILFLYEPKTDLELDRAKINDNINSKRCYYDSEGHGTHVAGIAAGGDPSTPYRGIAPEAELIIVKLVDFTDAEIIKALDYLRQKRRELNKPIVVNMSLGGHFGPHDGNSLLSRAVDNAVDDGLIVVVAAGNEADTALHASVRGLSSEVRIPLQTYTPGGDLIDGWYSGGILSVSLCKGTSCVSASPGAITSGSIGTCSVYIDNSVAQSPINGDGEFLVAYNCQGSFELKLSPSSGNPDVDLYFTCPFCYSEFLDYVDRDHTGGVLGTVGIPGTAKKAITVGAITSKPILGPSEVNIRSFEDLGQIAFFSSRGPTRDGRIKPDVVAGGYFVYSAINDGRSYGPDAGTSMATPVVAGIVALLIEDELSRASLSSKALNPDYVKERLLSYTVADASTGSLPNNIYGYGKVVLQTQSVPSPGETAPSSGGGGGGGCSIGGFNFGSFIIVLTLCTLLLRRVRGEGS